MSRLRGCAFNALRLLVVGLVLLIGAIYGLLLLRYHLYG
jgi:hypothetical protein